MMRNLPPITKNLLFANFIVWFLDILLQRYGIQLINLLGLWNPAIGRFSIWQPITYMFMHANFSHIFCNMFAVLMFGPALEAHWGKDKFLFYYIFCGIGAALVQLAVWHWVPGGVTIGASGAVFGILLAFGWLFPDEEMFILFLPIPISARTFVIIYAGIELLAGLAPIRGDNVAHFAHLGGMLFGLLLIWIWNHNWHSKWPKIKRDQTEDEDSRFKDYHYQERV